MERRDPQRQTAAAPRVSTFIVRALVEVVERSGVTREALMAAAKLDVARLDDILGGFAFPELVALEERALDLTGDEGLGLRLAEQSSEAAFDVVAHLTTHAPTLRDAVALCIQFQRLLMEGTALTLRERGDSATVRCEFPRSTLRGDLGLSTRSLRRRLAEDGASYKALVQSVLEIRATQMLGDPNRTIQETAAEMGFSDPSAFQRAFKRWKGMTPGQFKETKE